MIGCDSNTVVSVTPFDRTDHRKMNIPFTLEVWMKPHFFPSAFATILSYAEAAQPTALSFMQHHLTGLHPHFFFFDLSHAPYETERLLPDRIKLNMTRHTLDRA